MPNSSDVELAKMLWPRSGTGADLAEVLEAAGNAAANACNGGHQELVDKYLLWGSEQVRMLQPRISAADLARVVTTPRYWATVANPTASPATASAVMDELTNQARLLAAAADATRSAAKAWRLVDGSHSSLVVVDTNFWIEHEGSFSAIDWHERVADSKDPSRPRPGEELRLVVPIVVVDELDGLTHKGSVRAKASGAARWIYERLADAPDVPATIEPERDSQGAVTIQLVFDPPGHRRLPNNDDELIDRTIVYGDFLGVAPQRTFMLTYDAGAAFRARSAGMRPRLLPR